MGTRTDHRSRLAVGVVVLALGLAGCTSATGTVPSTTAATRHTTTTAPGTVTTTLEPERDVTVTGRHFKVRCAGSGPSVILVADFAQPMDDAWGTIPQTLATSSRVCAYDRLGIGRSDSPPDRQTFATFAEDLDGVISALGLARPVVVVGHATGAPIALTWASRHGADARAVVLLDPTPPGYFGPDGAFVRLLPPRDPGDPDLTNLWSEVDRFNDPATNKESLDPSSWAAYARLGTMSTPLYDLVEAQTPPASWPAAVDVKKIDATWRTYQQQVLAMSSPSEMVNVPTQDDWPATIRSTLDRALRS